MADLADMAVEIEAEHIAAGIRRIERDIPAGVAGECENCGEEMPRLVGGLCGFCRDGRRPLMLQPEPEEAAPPQTTKEFTTMTSIPKTDDSQTISVPVKGALLHSIRRRAAETGEPLGRTVVAMVEEGLLAAAMASPQRAWLADFDAAELVEELALRVSRIALAADMERDLNEAAERAAIAEAKLAAIAGMAIGEPVTAAPLAGRSL